MSDNFIPLTQSTPVQGKWQREYNQQQRYHNNRPSGGPRRHQNNWGNGSRSSYGVSSLFFQRVRV